MSQEYILMIGILILGVVGHNMSVAYAAGAILILKLLGLDQVVGLLGDKGINWGITLLTAAILVPIALGKITWVDFLNCFKSTAGVIALIMGILVAVSGHFGVEYMKMSPQVTTALIIGTMVGVFFFKGVPVGPLIAAGAVYLIMAVLDRF